MTKIMRKAIGCLTIAAMALGMSLSGCTNDIEKDIKDLQERVTSLESVTDVLQTEINNGAMIESIEPLGENGKDGYRITFTGGDESRAENYVDILHGVDGEHGNHGITPMLKVEEIDGKVVFSYNLTGDETSGWVTVEDIDLRGKKGDKGDQGERGEKGEDGEQGEKGDRGEQGEKGDRGEQGEKGDRGEQGEQGITPRFKVVDEGGQMRIYYTVSPIDTPENEIVWTDLGVDMKAPLSSNPLLSILENDIDGTVVFTLNDGNNTQYSFAKASSAVRFEIMNDSRVYIPAGEEGSITFRVNPSNAWIPTGDLSKWTLDQIGTRASYTNEAPNHEIVSIVKDSDKDGQYIATFSFDPSTVFFPAPSEYVMALVLNTGSEEKPVLVSSGTFVLRCKEVVATSISLDNTEAQLPVGGSLKLTPTLYPIDVTDKSITWSSSDEDVAFMGNNSTVYARKIGNATITATAVGGVKVSCEITVVPVALEGISLNRTSATLALTETEKLTISFEPGNVTEKDHITWSSSDETVATVKGTSGSVTKPWTAIVTSKKVGDAVITATYDHDGIVTTASCAITVTAEAAEVPESVEINGVVWATRNVGAAGNFVANPTDFGFHYQWGSTVSYDPAVNYYDPETMPTLPAVAYGDFNGDWDMENSNPCPAGYVLPTRNQAASLRDTEKVEYVFAAPNGIQGGLFIDKESGESIFLPAAATRIGTSPVSPNGNAQYWTSTMDVPMGNYAFHFNFYSGGNGVSNTKDNAARTLRCVAE